MEEGREPPAHRAQTAADHCHWSQRGCGATEEEEGDKEDGGKPASRDSDLSSHRTKRPVVKLRRPRRFLPKGYHWSYK